LNVFLIGYSTGLIEIRDTKTLKEVIFSHTFENGSVQGFTFHMEKFINLSVTHDNHAISNIILKVEQGFK
jgi:hypothetical protein